MADNRRTIVINPQQPLGLLLQSGMLSVRELREDVQRPVAPASMKADWQTIESWLGCHGRPFTDEDQARVHDALLIYIARGKAPSLALEEYFQFFVEQLQTEKIPHVTVPDAVFAVFHRLYATDAAIEAYHMDLTHILSTAELLKVEHPHFGKVQKLGLLKTITGLLTSPSRKAKGIDDYSSGKRQTVALHIEADNFIVTIASSFVLVTLKEGASRFPVIQKKWKLVAQKKGEGITEFFGAVNTYVDSDGLRWEHRFKRKIDEDELVGFDSNGKEILVITLETLQ
ncbi:hypothetical protein [Pseudomonas sp. P9_31]|uniref:hypothetical protein n=1 Tax=Pseudomonas sp. P9_31 TaxID=3043448 RepID=UPI002A36209A|nr:hypothetical protein [Pseudomonas sp. P9_31]WPN56317.1 hypothetical protein QMK51_19475 [Pseudomonas sp. P9_31]